MPTLNLKSLFVFQIRTEHKLCVFVGGARLYMLKHVVHIVTSDLKGRVSNCSRTPFIRKLVIRTANYPNWFGPSGKFVENATKLTCLEITGYRIKYSTVLWLLELQIRRGRKV